MEALVEEVRPIPPYRSFRRYFYILLALVVFSACFQPLFFKFYIDSKMRGTMYHDKAVMFTKACIREQVRIANAVSHQLQMKVVVFDPVKHFEGAPTSVIEIAGKVYRYQTKGDMYAVLSVAAQESFTKVGEYQAFAEGTTVSEGFVVVM